MPIDIKLSGMSLRCSMPNERQLTPLSKNKPHVPSPRPPGSRLIPLRRRHLLPAGWIRVRRMAVKSPWRTLSRWGFLASNGMASTYHALSMPYAAIQPLAHIEALVPSSTKQAEYLPSLRGRRGTMSAGNRSTKMSKSYSTESARPTSSIQRTPLTAAATILPLLLVSPTAADKWYVPSRIVSSAALIVRYSAPRKPRAYKPPDCRC